MLTLAYFLQDSLRITDTNCTYISQRITGHIEAGESQTAVSDRERKNYAGSALPM